jgi:hypothetical protein
MSAPLSRTSFFDLLCLITFCLPFCLYFVASDLKAALAAVESKGHSSDENIQKLASTTQKVVQLTEQNGMLHKALKKAKEVGHTDAFVDGLIYFYIAHSVSRQTYQG